MLLTFVSTQAVNKLAEIMNRKDNSKDKGKKVSSSEFRKKDKKCRELQQELQTEKEKFNQMIAKYQRELNECQASIADIEAER